MTSRTAMRREHDRQESLDQIRKTPADRASHRRRLVLGAWAAGLVMIVALVVAGLLSARPTQSADARLAPDFTPVSYTHLRAHETRHDLVCRLLLEKKKK